ncbi:MAG: DNA-3-methyladenine glycosylase [Frankiales bacterium]|nr:DNA-3-methyladenine glycosylase [Frankiales bacterium]
MRCFGEGDPLYEAYHDTEWGFPQRTERQLYEKICLEGMQAGLSWITVLRKREAFREVFHGFDPALVTGIDIEPLLLDARLIRARAKLQACVTNAHATLALNGGLVDLIWSYRHDGPAPTTWAEVPATTLGSVDLAKALRRHGFVFVGPTTAYSLMQACGVVNDHLATCQVRPSVQALREKVAR